MGSAANGRSGGYAGATGTTRTAETTIWCGGCGAWYGGRHPVSIDASTDPALVDAFLRDGFAGIGHAACPDCGAAHVIEEPFALHDRTGGRLFLVIPAGHRHRAQQHRAALIQTVAGTPGERVPGYAFEPILVAGAADLATRLHPAASVDTPAPRLDPPALASRLKLDKAGAPAVKGAEASAPPVEIVPIEALAPKPARSVELQAEVSVDAEMSLDVPLSVDLPAAADDAPVPPPRGAARRSSLLDEALAGLAEPPPSPVAAEERSGDGWDAAIDEAWSSVESAPGGSVEREDPTHVVKVDDLVPARRPAGPVFDAARAAGGDRYVFTEAGRIHAAARLAEDRARGFEEGDAALWFQVHTTPAGPLVDLLLVRSEGTEATSEVVDHVAFVLEPGAPAHEAVLDALEADFDVEVAFHGPDGEFHGRRRFRLPLEPNVRAAREALAEHARRLKGRPDFAGARRAFEADEFDRVGRLRHNFREDSFSFVRTAAEARLALGILSYWSAPERRDYLVRVRSFPLPWFDSMSRRVLEAAVHFGLAMDPHLRQRALDLGLAESSSALVRLCLAHFAEVSLNLRPNELDPLDAWDNWEALLAHAEELEVRVDEEIEELAALALERARAAAQGGDSMEINADVDSVELEEVEDLGELTAEQLINLLEDRAHRADAARTLLARSEPLYVPAIFDAIKVMAPEELLRVVPAALALGPSFEGSFLGGLRSRRPGLRLASALFLAEIRSERAALPLLRLVSESGDAEWPILARAAARMGRRILTSAIDHVAEHGDAGDRVATTLALLGPEARGALAAAQDRAGNPAVRACFSRALERMGGVSFGDPADFTERLADAFRAGGPDHLGPDFEEDLVSIDLGPAASIDDSVDLGSLDGPPRK